MSGGVDALVGDERGLFSSTGARRQCRADRRPACGSSAPCLSLRAGIGSHLARTPCSR